VSNELDRLHADLMALRDRLGAGTLERHARQNPFMEDLVDWRERGRAWTGEDRGVTVYDSATLIGDVEIGDHTWVGPFTILDGSGGLTVGHHCSIAAGCQLLSHDTASWALSGGVAEYERAPTSIGDCCFVGSLTVVLKGVTVGDHCLIGAGSVVTRDVPPYSIVAGTPARVVGSVELDPSATVRLRYDDTRS
jgi:carbonic anhydrase/acetyltransferase-like protein (isoleucine patch superfamily)